MPRRRNRPLDEAGYALFSDRRDEIGAMDTPRERSGARTILTVNGGSSSLKVAVFSSDAHDRRILAVVDRIGQPDAALVTKRSGGEEGHPIPIGAADHARALEKVVEVLDRGGQFARLNAIGQRIVHGGLRLLDHQRVTDGLLEELRSNVSLDRAHLPQEIALIERASRMFPAVPQVACFDTAFHRDLPRVAQLLPIPRKYLDAGFRRLGFHGLSFSYLRDELRRLAGDSAADGRVIFAHLGSGSSLAAVLGGRPVDTTMGLTPSGGLVMGTRPGDLDPGLLVHMARLEGLSPDDMDALVNERCGLRGVSDLSADMRTLLERRRDDPRAADAVDLYVYQVRKGIGAFAAALGGLDTLVFSGGIGERAAEVRSSVAAGLRHLGLVLDERSNAAHASVVSTDSSAVTVRVIPTDEEIVIARIVKQILEES
jgi:acetate kinase